MSGLSLERIRRAYQIIALNKTLDTRSIELILKEKRQIIYQTQILEFCLSENTISDIGGLKFKKLVRPKIKIIFK